MASKRKPPEPFGDFNDPYGMAVLLAQFLDWMRVKNYSEETTLGRHGVLNRFIRWADERGVVRPNEVTKPILERYQRYLFHFRKKNGDPISFRTQHANLATIRAWFKWLARNNHILYNPASDIELPKLGHRLPRYVLTASEAEKIIAIADVDSKSGLRDRAILETLYSTGIRRMEICNLRLYDVDHDRGTVMVRQGKGQKDRMVPIGERALAWIDRYVTEVRPLLESAETEDNTLFLTDLGKQFTPDQMTAQVRQYVNAADVGKPGACHLWRHTAATLMLEAGADIRFIQVFLGHAKLTTTEIYTQVAIKQLKAIHAACHPSSKLKRGDTQAGLAESLDLQGRPPQGKPLRSLQHLVLDAANDILRIVYHPDFRINRSSREDVHPKEEFVFGHRRAMIDVRLKSLIDQLWRYGCETVGCCEEHAPDRAYIQFLSPQSGGDLLAEALRHLGIAPEITNEVGELDLMKDGKKLGVFRFDSVRVEFPTSAINAIADSLKEHGDKLRLSP